MASTTRKPICLSSSPHVATGGHAIRCTAGPAAGMWWTGGGWGREEIAVYATQGEAEDVQEEAGEYAPSSLVSKIVQVHAGRHYA